MENFFKKIDNMFEEILSPTHNNKLYLINFNKIIIDYLVSKGFTFILKEENKHTHNNHDLILAYKNRNYTYKTSIICFDNIDDDTKKILDKNILIELEFAGYKSGISVAKSDFFIIYNYHSDVIINISTEKLLQIIDSIDHEYFYFEKYGFKYLVLSMEKYGNLFKFS